MDTDTELELFNAWRFLNIETLKNKDKENYVKVEKPIKKDLPEANVFRKKEKFIK